MKKIIITISLFLSSVAYSGTLTIPTTYATNGTVTAANLNGNFTAISQVINGGIDNTNSNTTQGYRLYQTVSTLPSSGNQGAVYFLTTDNTLNFDTGSSFIKSVSVNTTPSQGDIIYYTGSTWTTLSAGSNGQFLETQGTSANPTWATVVPSGVIVMWSGTIATIPSGWVLCNGSNGTPDLRNLFVVGANADSGGVAKSTITGSAAQSGGSTTIDITQIPAHTHSINVYSVGGGFTGANNSSSPGALSGTYNTNSAGGGLPYVQPFYALAYIMKT